MNQAFKSTRAKKPFEGAYRNSDILFILPWLIGFCAFTLFPFLFSLFISFTKYNMLGSPTWAGMYNYITAFTDDPLVLKSLGVTFKYVIISVPLRMVMALCVALLLNNKVKGARLFRTIYYLPSLLGGTVAIAIVWKAMFTRNGVFNGLLALFGIQGLEWIGNPNTALYVLALLPVWQFGSSMVIFLAGLNAIPKQLLEAAEVDGAGSFRKFFNITFPLLTPTVFFNLVMQMIGAFQTFTSAHIVTQGGPINETLLFVLNIYNQAFQKHRFGYASALSWILLLIILVFTIVLFRTQRLWVYYEEE